jgi:hypothetical protein
MARDGERGGPDGFGVANHMTPAGREGTEGQSGGHFKCEWIHHTTTWKKLETRLPKVIEWKIEL